MQNKSAIWVFTILLVFTCLYQLSFTWVTGNVENTAEQVAMERVDSVIAVEGELSHFRQDSLRDQFENEYLLSVAHEAVYPVFGYSYKKSKQRELNLGLDLQGGMHVVLEISVMDMIKALSGYNQDPAFLEALSRARQLQKETADDYVTLFGKAFNEIAPDARLAAIFHTRETQDKFPRDASNEEILEIIKKEARDAVSRTEHVLRKRIDNLGVVQPSIQRLGTTGRIAVELPGVRDKERVRRILQGTAKLEFWETYDNKEVFNNLESANELLKKRLKANSDNEVTEEEEEQLTSDEKIPETGDVQEEGKADAQEEEVLEDEDEEELDLLEQLGMEEEDTVGADTVPGQETFDDFAKENPLFGVLRPALVQDPASGNYFPGEGPVVGYAALKDTGKVNRYLAMKEIKALFPPRIQFLWAASPFDEEEQLLQLYAIKVTTREGTAPLEGDAVANARVETDQVGNPEVGLTMHADGAKKWKLLTKDNIGKSVAIVLDDKVYSAPTVQAEISGGRSSISGRFTMEEAEDLANVLKAGKLPAPANIIEEAVVGPSLGEEAVRAGFTSFAVALLLILLYMIFYYARAGAVSNIALIANIFFVLGVLASLGATLTLPGIAGIVLTIGMSVDANVLIYERIREEVAAGKGIRLAIADGYQAAYSSILDANITTLLTGIILLVFGTGPIQGFATTLIVGILTSLFSAIFITRLIFEWFLTKKQHISFATKITEGAFKNLKIKFIDRRKIFYVVSGVVLIAGFVSFATRGLNYGVDFTGGRSFLVRFDQPVDVTSVGNVLENAFVTPEGLKQRPEVKTFGAANQVKITTKFMIDSDDKDVDQVVEARLTEGLTDFDLPFELMSSQKVGPTIAEDIKTAAIWAVLFSLVVIFLYIMLRFRKWQFGLSALAAMTHDVLIVLSIFSIFYGIMPFSLEIDQAFIAAILTVVGYSINDTVVVFDRIREYLGLYKKKEMNTVVNEALNSTLSRTINTSVTTFFVLLLIFIFGGEVIRGFVFALMIGVIVGTYSSLYVASPLVTDMIKKKPIGKK